ncbi:MAG: hypothetical protein VB078_09075 [Clostridiaceae bacterium]|nr:hypothetical protein [Clostridiaceae bacterium]
MMQGYDYESDFLNMDECSVSIYPAKSENDSNAINLKSIKFDSTGKKQLHSILLDGRNVGGIKELSVTLHADINELNRLKARKAYRGSFVSRIYTDNGASHSLIFYISLFSFDYSRMVNPISTTIKAKMLILCNTIITAE